MEKTLKELAELVGGEIKGDPKLLISGIADIEEARSGEITFISRPKYMRYLGLTSASAIIVSEGSYSTPKSLIFVKNPYLAYAKVQSLFSERSFIPIGIDARVVIGKDCLIGENSSIFPFVFIGNSVRIGNKATVMPFVYIGDNVTIGDDTIIYPNVTIREGTVIGKKVIIHAGTVIGSDGFGFVKEGERNVKIPQVGMVEISDEVEIGALNAIDRGAFTKTWIKKGVKTDNLVQIGHNVIIGENSVVVAQVGISGSVEVGRNSIIAGQVGVAGHIKIGDNVTIGSKSGVTKNIPSNWAVSGFPAIPHKDFLKVQISLQKVPEMRKALNVLQNKVNKLEEIIKENQKCL